MTRLFDVYATLTSKLPILVGFGFGIGAHQVYNTAILKLVLISNSIGILVPVVIVNAPSTN